jgi:acyl-CoA synthetase (AMP-forming)/AMP-acid ligase II/acyl carrier protein
LAEFQPSWYTAVPSLHQAVLEQAAAYQEVIARYPLRFIRSSSAALPAKVMVALERVFQAPVIEAYGMTEASHQMASNPLPPQPRKMGSVGLAAGPEVAIMAESDHFLPRGMTGEIVIRGETVTGGYENNPAANGSAFIEGWFRTGDQGYLDEEGYLFVTGRLKEIINRGGEKVAPREVDEVLLEHPAVVQAVTFAVPHPTLGEDIAAAVVLREPHAITEGQLREFAFTRLADYKVPSQVIVVAEIPKGPTGKLQRLGLAELLGPQIKAEFVEPREPVEALLAGIWMQTLEVERVGIYDNFFSLGGDSLRATQVIARVREVFQIDLPLKTIFREPTVADQALAIEEILMNEIEGLTEEEAYRLAE